MSALYYYRARTYDPKVGRFLQTDPVGPRPEEMNAYVYVGNNPLNYADPSGLVEYNWQSCEAPAAIECEIKCQNYGGVKKCEEKWKKWVDIDGKTMIKQKVPGQMTCICNNEDRYNWCPAIPSPSPVWLLPLLPFIIPALL